MIYYLFLAIIDIGWFLADNWKELTGTAIATGVGFILGKRIGSRMVVQQVMKLLGLEKKSTLEQQVMWLLELEKARGNVWSVSMSPSERKGLVARLKSLRKVGWLARFANVTTHPQGIYPYQRRKKNMSKFKSRKFILAIVGALLIILNEGLDMGIDSETVLAFAGLLAVWISGESYVDGKRAEGVTTSEPTPTISTSEFEG